MGEPVKSSNLKEVDYDADSNTLTITFKKSKTPYVYSGVSEHEYNELIRSRSKGTYFNTHLKSKQFTRKR